jgi:hypothetical protein
MPVGGGGSIAASTRMNCTNVPSAAVPAGDEGSVLRYKLYDG